ncbi:hypothetical protein Leryth_017963 [Lithospermum erythrorhizon]|nr:hypothetical protein Leryth_017963 [Lithospermum erythrorhizon]
MMEVLPFSGIGCVGDADCSQQGSGTTFVDDGESEHLEHGGQDGSVDLKGKEPQEGKEIGGQWPIDVLPISEGNSDGSSYFDCLVESSGQMAPNNSHDSEDKLHQQGLFSGHGQLMENFELIVDTIEYGQEATQEPESSLTETVSLEQEEPLPVWVKRRGKWQAAIRCAQPDWPLASLKAKPPHDWKKYLLVFFPCMRNYSWVDVLLIRPIHEFPQPIAYKTHEMGIEMLKDSYLPRRFILLKLSLNLLNLLEQLNSEVLVEVACNAASWKKFAAEVSQCNSYSDTGKMLLKLQKMMKQCFFRSNWLHFSSQSWIQRCLEADSAESVELLKEELVGSIIWNDVNCISSQGMQLELGSEMKTWKHEAMKWFSLLNPTEHDQDTEPTSANDSTLVTGLQTSRKRAKLEVRRAEAHTSQMETESSHQQITLEVDSGFFSNHDVLLGSGCLKEEVTEDGASLMGGSPVTDRWGDIVIQAENSDVIQMKDLEITAASSSMKPLPENKNHQCTVG